MTTNKRRVFDRLNTVLGLSFAECETLWRAQCVLHRWAELECGDGNGCIERDEKTGLPFWRNANTSKLTRISDRETPALRRVAEVAKRRGLGWYHQTDPRGCALYVGTPEMLGGADVESAYNRLIAVC